MHFILTCSRLRGCISLDSWEKQNMCMCVYMDACVYNISLMGDISVSIYHSSIYWWRETDWLWGIDSRDHGAWEILQSTTCKLKPGKENGGIRWGRSYNSIQVLKLENLGSWWWYKSQPKRRRLIYCSGRQAGRKWMLSLTHGGRWSTLLSPPIQMLVHKETCPKMTPETKFNLGIPWLAKLTHKIKLCRHVCVLSHFSHVGLFATLWTVACQAPLSMGFSKQQYWSGLPCPPGESSWPKDGTQSHRSPALAGKLFATEPPAFDI